jgi:hypothetical protein
VTTYRARSFTAHNTTLRTVVLSVFFAMGKMVISQIYYLENFPLLPIQPRRTQFIYFISFITTISFYISDNTLILLIRLMSTTSKKTVLIELISIIRSLHIYLFY